MVLNMKIEYQQLKNGEYDNTFLWVCYYSYNNNKMLVNLYRNIRPTKISIRINNNRRYLFR